MLVAVAVVKMLVLLVQVEQVVAALERKVQPMQQTEQRTLVAVAAVLKQAIVVLAVQA
jgi:hypothetical protein